MMNRTIVRVTCVVASCAGLLAQSVADSVSVETVRVGTPAGIELSTDIWHPGAERAPVILVRTPYGRRQLEYLARPLAESGYVVAVQDVRGRYESSGEHEPFRHERVDGETTLRWLAEQSWCDGSIGMWGSSYSGYAALSVADIELPAFRSIFSVSGWLDVEDVVRPGGANHLMLNLPWMLTQQGRTQRNLNEFDVDALFRHLPMRDALRAAGIRNETWEDPDWLEEAATTQVALDEIRRPILQMTGWHDMVYRATLRTWDRVVAESDHAHKLVVGPWYHNQFLFGAWEVGDASFGRASGMGADELVALTVQWFDATLRGEDRELMDRAPVTYFVMGENAWRDAEAWPPPAAKPRRWYLAGGGSANSAAGDGELRTSPPDAAGRDRFVFDPGDPVPTVGGANFFYFPDLVGVRDQRAVEARDDVLVYTSEPLEQELRIAGRVTAHLRVATSGADTDFTAKLVVVRPDGYARIVEDGIARVSHVVAPRPAAGTPFSVEIDLGYTAIAVPERHRLRLEVSSSNFPKYDRNPNNGEDPYLAEELHTAEQTVFHGGDAPSWLELPVMAATPARPDQLEPLVELGTAVAAGSPGAGDAAAGVEELVARGRRLLESEDGDGAISALEQAVEQQPDAPDSHYWLGRAYLVKLNQVGMFEKLGFAKKVNASFQRAVDLDPDHVDARASLARFYLSAPSIAGGSVDKGIEQAEEIVSRDPRQGHLLLAEAHLARKDPVSARKAYDAVIALDPSDAATRYRLGLLCQEEKDWSGAFDVFEAAVEVTGDPRCLYQLGRTAVLSGQRLERGKRAFEQYIEDGKGEQVPHAHWRLGMVHEKLGAVERARESYRTALLLDPSIEQAQDALDNLGQ